MLKSIWYKPFSQRDAADAVYGAVFGGGDDLDNLGWHVVLTVDDHPAAAGRLDYVKAGVGRLSRIAVLPQYRRMKLGDSIVKLLVFKAGELGLNRAEAEAEGEGAAMLKAAGFKPGENNFYTKEICDGCCENCADKRTCPEE